MLPEIDPLVSIACDFLKNDILSLSDGYNPTGSVQWALTFTMICNMLQGSKDMEDRELASSTLQSPTLLSPKQLDVAMQRIKENVNATTTRASHIAQGLLMSQLYMDGSQALQKRRKMEAAAQDTAALVSCLRTMNGNSTSCSDSTHTGVPHTQGSVDYPDEKACCLTDFTCLTSNRSVAERLTEMCATSETTAFEKLICQVIPFVHDELEQAGIYMVTRCSSYLTYVHMALKTYLVPVHLIMARLGTAIPPIGPDHWARSETTIIDLITSNTHITAALNPDYVRYFDECHPQRCTFYSDDIGARLFQTIALTLGFVGGIMQLVKSVLESATVAIPEKYWPGCCGDAEVGEDGVRRLSRRQTLSHHSSSSAEWGRGRVSQPSIGRCFDHTGSVETINPTFDLDLQQGASESTVEMHVIAP